MPSSLFTVAALLIQHNLVSLEDLLPHVSHSASVSHYIFICLVYRC